MPRVHPVALKDGAFLVPLANENFNLAAMAITRDGGETWTFSRPVPGIGVTQPSVVQRRDGRLVAFFRDATAAHRIHRSESGDGGLTWSPVAATSLPNPGGGIEAIALASGDLAIIYNDKESSPRDRLAVSISSDEGQTLALDAAPREHARPAVRLPVDRAGARRLAARDLQLRPEDDQARHVQRGVGQGSEIDVAQAFEACLGERHP